LIISSSWVNTRGSLAQIATIAARSGTRPNKEASAASGEKSLALCEQLDKHILNNGLFLIIKVI
jgi:hypothetical protein